MAEGILLRLLGIALPGAYQKEEDLVLPAELKGMAFPVVNQRFALELE